MSEASRGGRSAGSSEGERHTTPEIDVAWDELEAALADYLVTMVDPDEADILILELVDPDPEADGCRPYVQFSGFDEGRGICAEISGNATLSPAYTLGDAACRHLRSRAWLGNDEAAENWYVERPLAESGQIVDQVVWALRYFFGIAHPQLLTHRAWGPAADGVGRLPLWATSDLPLDEPSGDPGSAYLASLAVETEDRDELVSVVAGVLREKYECEPTVDDDGDFVLRHLGQPVWVRVRTEQPAVEIMARVAHDVHSRRAAAVEVGLLNRDNVWMRWTQRDRHVWQSVAVPGMPFAPAHLDAMLDLFFEAMDNTREDLAFRLRATVA